MRKNNVIAGLIIFTLGTILAICIQETAIQETLIDEWSTINPSELYPHWNYDANEFNVTGYAFMDRAKIDPEKNILVNKSLELYLDLNISATGVIRLRVGKIILKQSYEYGLSPNYEIKDAIFNENGTKFYLRVRVDESYADFLDITNMETFPVKIVGSIKLYGKILETIHPLKNFWFLLCLASLSLIIYGLITEPRKKIKSRYIKRAHLLIGARIHIKNAS
jgi:hypothetical protein